MAKVQVYTTTYCPFCTRAKTLLKNKGVAFEEMDIARWRPEQRPDLIFANGALQWVSDQLKTTIRR